MLNANHNLLEYFRCRPCESCGRSAPSEPHHIKPKGHGGGSRLDVALNLVSLCGGPYGCHAKLQEGRKNQVKCWALVARREGLSGWRVAEAAIQRLLRTH